MHVLVRNPAFVSELCLGKICIGYCMFMCTVYVHACIYGGGALCSYRPTLICSHSLVINRQEFTAQI